MAKVLSMSRVRAVSGAADQIFSSLSNGLVIYAIAVVTATENFGEIALLLTLLAAAIGVLRGALGTPLLLAAGRSADDIRREGSFAVTTALLVSPVAGGIMWAVGGAGTSLPTMLVIAATPIVLVEDVLRYVAIALGRPHIAALWDGLWFAGSAALLLVTWLHLPVATTTYLLGGWTALALTALIGMLAGVRVGPRFDQYRAWIADGWQHRARYGADSGLEQTTVFVVLLFVAVVLSPGVSATLRGATALLAPVAIATSAIPLVVIPESKQRGLAPRQVWSSLARIALLSTCGTLLFGVGLFFLPGSVGEFVLGSTFEATRAIIPIIAFEYALGAWPIAVAIFLRTLNRSADALLLKVIYVLVLLGTALGGAMMFGTAAGVATGIATAMTFITALALTRFRPWASPPGSRGPESFGPVPPLSSPTDTDTDADTDPDRAAAAGGVAADAVPTVCTRRPPPLVTRLRLHEPAPVNQALISLWTVAILAVFVPALIIRFTGISNDWTWLWSLPAIAICSARMAWLIGVGERRLFEMMFWMYSYMFLGLAPLAQLREHEWPATVPRVDATFVVTATLMVIVGCGAFLAGSGLDNATSLRRLLPTSRNAGDVTRTAFTINYPRTVVLCAFAILLNVYYLSSVGWVQFLMSRDELTSACEAIWPQSSAGVMVRPCSYMALLVAFIALMRFRGEAKRARARGENVSQKVMRSNMTLIVIIGMLLANSMNPISNARYLSGTAMLAVATSFGLFATRQRFRIVASGFLAGMLLIFPLADAFRYSSQADFKAANPIESLLSPDYDSFAQLMNGYLAGAREGIVPGKQLSGVLLFWMPRAFWSDKPVDTGIYIANVRGYTVTNLSAPLWIELYLNGGWVVLAVGMFALGFGLHRWDSRLNAQFDVDRMPGLVSCILPFYLMILLRGSLLQAASFLFFVLFFSLFVRQRKRVKLKPRALTKPLGVRPALSGAGLGETAYVPA